MTAYPEHDRLEAVAKTSQAIGEFLEWLRGSEGVHLMTWKVMDDQLVCPAWRCEDGRRIDSIGRDTGPCARCGGTGFTPTTREAWAADGRSTDRLLAAYFEIDLDKLEAEKRAMLADFRAEVAP